MATIGEKYGLKPAAPAGGPGPGGAGPIGQRYGLQRSAGPQILEDEGALDYDERMVVRGFGSDQAAIKEFLERQPGVGGKAAGYSLVPEKIPLGFWLGDLDLSGISKQPFLQTGRSRQYETIPYKDQLAARPKGDTGPYRPIDPQTGFFSKDFAGDVVDILPDILSAQLMAQGGGTGLVGKAVDAGVGATAGEEFRKALGEEYGMRRDKTIPEAIGAGEMPASVETGLWAGGIQGGLGLAGAGLGAAAKAAGTKNPLKWPLLTSRYMEKKAGERLDRITGREAELAKVAAAKAEQEAAKETAKAAKLEEVLKAQAGRAAAQKEAEAAREAKRQAISSMKARGAGEAAHVGRAGVEATEYTKEAARIRAEASALKQHIKDLKVEPGDPIKEQLESQLGELQDAAAKMVEKARETRSRAGLTRQMIRERAAREAAEATGKAGEYEPGGPKGPVVPRPEGPPPIAPVVITPEVKAGLSGIEGMAKPGESLPPPPPGVSVPPETPHGIYQKTSRKVHEMMGEAADRRHESAQLAADRVITWDVRRQIAKEVSDAAQKGKEEAWNDAYRRIAALGESQGMNREQAVRFAAEEVNLAKARIAVETPPSPGPVELPGLAEQLGRIPKGAGEPAAEEIAERAGQRGAEHAIGQLRTNVGVGPATYWRMTGDAAARGAALLGDLFENPPFGAEIKRGTARGIGWLTSKAPPSIRSVLDQLEEIYRTKGKDGLKRAFAYLSRTGAATALVAWLNRVAPLKK